MTRRSLAAIGAIVLVVAGLAVWRSQRQESAPPVAIDDALAAVIVAGRPTVLDFGRGECAACKEMKPVLDELAARHEGRVTVKILDLKEASAQALADSMRIVLIPTQVFLDASGREVARHEGSISLSDLEAEMGRHGWTPAR